jgi:hypothetical protein
MHEILDHPGIRTDLGALLTPVHAAYKQLINSSADTALLNAAIDRIAAGLAEGDGIGHQYALAVQTHLGALDGSSAFWSTPLGRVLAWYGFAPVDPRGSVSPSVVGAVLGMSRQRAAEIQKSGRLLTAQRLADELKRRHTDAMSG